MSDDQNKPRGGVRRVGQKDQKKRLSPPDSLFPLEDFVDEEELATQANELSLADDTRPHEAEEVDAEPLPFDEPDEPGVMDYAPPSPEDARFAPPVTPAEERFPPVAPKIKEPPATPKQKPEPQRRRFVRQDAIALLFAFGTVGLCAYFSLIWVNPYSPLNPLAPPTPLPIVITATPLTGANAEPSAESNATATFTPFLSLVVTEEPTASAYPFALSTEGILYMPNANGSECNWSSIAGTVTDTGGQPLNGYRVRVTSPEDASFDESVFSGSTLTFGAGGFELPLGGAPQAGLYSVRLFDSAGAPVSDEYEVATRAECDANVVVVNFVEAR